MRFDILTIFPEMFESPFKLGVISKAVSNKIIQVNVHNLRDFAVDKHKSVDDKPFGGVKGMVLKPEPIFKAFDYICSLDKTKNPYVILTSPRGTRFSQEKAKWLASLDWILIICGRYEGVDERVTKIVDEEISIGDYVLTGGELPAMILVDAISRLIPGVVKEKESVEDDSFYSKFLAPPVYTRPREFMGMKVPEILLSGNHKKIKKWMTKESIRATMRRRPDLIDPSKFTSDERKIYEEIVKEESE